MFLSDVTETVYWDVYGYVYQVVIKFGPLIIIFALNVATVVRLRKVWRRRIELVERAEMRSRRRLDDERSKGGHQVMKAHSSCFCHTLTACMDMI